MPDKLHVFHFGSLSFHSLLINLDLDKIGFNNI